MNHTGSSVTHTWSLDAVIDGLQQQPPVEGLLLIGSAAKQELTPASDYDLVMILRDAPYPWSVGVTTVDGRFTDLIFVDFTALANVQALSAPVAPSHELAPILRWLREGAILFDRSGLVGRAQQMAQRQEWLLPVNEEAAYAAWFSINYNLAVATRLVAATDPLYQTTAGIRMAVYGHSDLWFGYFTIRQITWAGDKAAVRYLQQHDPQYLEIYQQFIAVNDLKQKLSRYEQAAAMATAPLGGVWSAQVTVMNDVRMLLTWQAWLGETE